MTIDLSNSTDFEILQAAKVLSRIDAITRNAHIDYLVVGATARNIISVGLLGTLPERQTKDVDIAAEVDSWNAFEELAKKLHERRGVHKFVVEGSEVDIIPYGGIEEPDRTILWPDDHQMNVIGLREAVDSAENFILPGGTSVKVPSIPALALLKIFAWRDRRSFERRDAIDLAAITRWYSEGEYLELLYTEELATLEHFEFDPVLAGAYLLGSHIRGLLDEEGGKALMKITNDGDLQGKLANDMGTIRASIILEAMCAGIRGAV